MRAHTITTKPRVGACIAVCAAVALGLAAPSGAAAAATFKGSTDQGLDVTVRVGDDGLVNRVNIENRVRCQQGPDHITGHSTYRAPLDESTPTSFADNKRTTTHGRRVRVKHEITGEKISDTEWTGTAQRKIRTNGHVSGNPPLRCETGEIGWSATFAS